MTRAAVLVNADLTTSMVAELAVLMGLRGSSDARRGGESGAIFEHTLTRHVDNELPGRCRGRLLAIADRVNALAASSPWGCNREGRLTPTRFAGPLAASLRSSSPAIFPGDLDEMFAYGRRCRRCRGEDAMADLRAFLRPAFRAAVARRGHPAILVWAMIKNASRLALAARVLSELESLAGSKALVKAGAAYRRAGGSLAGSRITRPRLVRGSGRGRL